MASLVWLNSACNCWTVSCISLQSAGSLLLRQEYRRTARKCQRYSQKWLCTLTVISQIITDILKLSNFDIYKKYFKNALLSLFLTDYHCSHRYQSQCHRRLPNLNVPYFEWLNVQFRHICQPQTWSHQDSQALAILLGLLHLDFNQVLWHEGTVCPVYFPLYHSQYASHGHLLGEWF